MTRDSKGFSSIVGAVFAALVMFSLISTVFVWSLAQNTRYNNEVRQSNQEDLDRSNEKIVANVTAKRVDDANVLVEGTLQNDGSLSVQLVTMWVADDMQKTYASESLGLTMKPGNVTNFSHSVALPNSFGDNLTCWFITGRGNTIYRDPIFAAFTDIDIGDTITYSDVSSGIGLLGFNFKEFSKIDLGTSLPANHTLLGPFQKEYWLRQNHYTIFHVILTNYDPDKQDMVLNSSSLIYALIVQSGTVKFAFWPIVNVTGTVATGLYVHPIGGLKAEYTLHYDEAVDVYFLGPFDVGQTKYAIPAIASPSVPAVYPLNIMAFGQLGTMDYGQNVPFVSLNLLS